MRLFALLCVTALAAGWARPAAAQVAVLDARASDHVAADLGSMEAAVASRAAVALVLPGGDRVVARPSWTEQRGPGRFSWSGPIDGGGHAVVTVEAGFVVARVVTGTDVVVIETGPDGVHHARAPEPEAEWPTDAVRAPPQGASDVGMAPDALWPDVAEIALFYTASTAAALGASLPAFLQANLDAFNDVLRNSAVPMRVRYAYAGPVAYEESGDFFADFYAFADEGSSLHAQAASARAAYGADLAALITTNAPQYCGVAYLMDPVRPEFWPSAYSVTRRTCAVANLTLPHEVGHNMGLRHDAYVDPTPTPFPFSHGFVNTDSLDGPAGRTGFRTVMAYTNACTDLGGACPKVPFYSRADTLYAGQAVGDAATAANARALTSAVSTVTGFRTPALLAQVPLDPGGAPTWTRPVCADPADVTTCTAGSGTPEAYAASALTVAPAGRYTARRSGTTGGALFLYAGPFRPDAPLDGLVAVAEEDPGAPAARRLLLERALAAETAYTLVVSAPAGGPAGLADVFGPQGAAVFPVAADDAGAAPGVTLVVSGPNPFGRSTAALFVPARSGPVRAALVDALGRHVRTVFSGEAAGGLPLRLDVDGGGLAPGLYVLRVEGGGTVQTLRLFRAR
ncbi:MAG TPA: zinc-dependent metalloprotease [Rubricoccaceae bacterium]